jgi:tetratricopeptide (TPR) repeat protein
MVHPATFPVLKFAVRQATAFVGHSFAPEDEEIVNRLTEFFSKLGVVCETGKRAEPTSVSDKIRKRIKEAELFIGIFTRRGVPRPDRSFEASSWIIEEKAVALAEGKRVLIFVENGVKEFGGMQGDLEYIPFDRENFGDALLKATDYILAVTSVPVQSRVDGNSVHITIGDNKQPQERITDLQKLKALRPRDVSIRLSLAQLFAETGDPTAALRELEYAKTDFPNHADVIHQLGHHHQKGGDLAKAIACYEQSIELNSAHAKYYLCYAKALYEQHKTADGSNKKREVLERAKRFLTQGSSLSAEPNLQKEIGSYLFLTTEALNKFKNLSTTGTSTAPEG